MGEYAQPPADTRTPGIEVSVDVEDRDGNAGAQPVVDLPDVAVDVDVTDADAALDRAEKATDRLDRSTVD